MTEQQAIERMRYRIDTATEIAGKGEDGKAFEDMEMAIKALEKQIEHNIKTKIRYGMGNEYEDCYCPSCDDFICYEPQKKDYSKVVLYCPTCGQKLKWY